MSWWLWIGLFLLPPGSEAHDHLRLNPCVEGGDAGTPGIRSRGLSPLPRPLSCGFQFSRFKGRLMALKDIKATKVRQNTRPHFLGFPGVWRGILRCVFTVKGEGTADDRGGSGAWCPPGTRSGFEGPVTT